ncbi:hypothetical protein [Sinorhizobium meliloti]|uniref:hypothetical protein n=1 Tax=Rhizobium meliloti TaxID=382 RepID=UPI000FDA2D1D|nr:hypothetical protein [Sinorhizobium meliloti]RVG20638.1 hypothetical protein CN231_04430 [Sinorhizobium meliloti]
MFKTVTRSLVATLVAFTVLTGQSSADTVASTSDWTKNSDGLPTSAETVFYKPLWNKSMGVAQHELLHAIAFAATAFPKFSAKIDSSRDFWSDDAHTVTRLARLTAAAKGTHIDPSAGVINGFDQSKSIMRPSNVDGLKAAEQEQQVVDAPFSWSGKNIKIVVAFAGGWSSQERQAVNDAVNAVKKLLGSDGSGSGFTWTVSLDSAPTVAAKGAESMSQPSDNKLMAAVLGDDPQVRTIASATLLQQGLDAIDTLVESGASAMSGLAPRRLDVIYSILTGETSGRYKTNTFGLHLLPGTTSEVVREIGDRTGFILAEGSTCSTDQFPSCYVTVRQGADMWEVMTRLLSTEPAVVTVNLNYIEY